MKKSNKKSSSASKYLSKWQQAKPPLGTRKQTKRARELLDKLCWLYSTAEVRYEEQTLSDLLPNQREPWPREKRFCVYWRLFVKVDSVETLDGWKTTTSEFKFDPTLFGDNTCTLFFAPTRHEALKLFWEEASGWERSTLQWGHMKQCVIRCVDLAHYCGLSYEPFEPKPLTPAERLKQFLISLQDE